ncbi:MAG: hypothetical protein JRE71_19960 [Deltaproteobacteria bacterium]|nr:hypothetical protein [Deltaproteobacteria bacterium]
MTFPPEVWDGVLRRLKTALAPVSFEMWIPQIVAKSDGDCLELVCPTQFHCDRVREYFLSTIGDCVEAEAGRRVPLRVEVGEPPVGSATDAGPSESVAAIRPAAESTPPVRKRAFRRSPQRASRRAGGTLSIDQALGTVIPLTVKPSSGLEAVASDSGQASIPTPSTQIPIQTQTPIQTAKSITPSAPAIGISAAATAHVANPTAARRLARPPAAARPPAFPLTFDSFTVGSCNALAREAALAFASQQPSQMQLGLNQLYIVSEAGLGKTHLSRAVLSATAGSTGDRARYTTAESFTSEFTHAVRAHQMSKFKGRYRTHCDLLVFEDVQFLEGKTATQLEFFHTVQHVLDCGGRVLLTGDKFPQELSRLDERARARISSGFVAHLDAPDAIVRRNILRAKAAHGGVRLPDDCVDLLVETIEGSVRELEGALIQLVTISSLFKRPINLELTQESLQGRNPRSKTAVDRATPSDIIEAVARFFQTSPASLASRSRRRDVLVPRQLSMYLCRRYTDASLADIGRLLNRDHPAVANAVRKIERQLLENVRLRYQVEALIGRLDELGHRPLHTPD